MSLQIDELKDRIVNQHYEMKKNGHLKMKVVDLYFCCIEKLIEYTDVMVSECLSTKRTHKPSDQGSVSISCKKLTVIVDDRNNIMSFEDGQEEMSVETEIKKKSLET